MPTEKLGACAIEIKGRLFNILKLRERLLCADALLRPIAQLWILAIVFIGAPYAYDPTVYPIYWGQIISTIIFASYYGLIGAVRRNTEIYLEKLAVTYGHDLTKESLSVLQKKLDAEKPFKDCDDPKLVRNLFAMANFFHLPRRGLVQQTVVVSQLIFLLYYAFNYGWFFGCLTPEHFPEILWQLHGAVTLFGVIMMVKNASFLLDNRFFLAITKAVLDPKQTGLDVIDAVSHKSPPPPAVCALPEKEGDVDSTKK